MANYLVLEDIKAHLNVDFDDDDDYISSLMDMVENAVAIEIETDLEDLEDESDMIPLRLLHGMFLLVGHFYLIREPVSIGVSVTEIPLAFKFLIAPFKNWIIS